MNSKLFSPICLILTRNVATKRMGIWMIALVLVTKPAAINKPQAISSTAMINDSADEFSANTATSACIIDLRVAITKIKLKPLIRIISPVIIRRKEYTVGLAGINLSAILIVSKKEVLR